MGKKIVIINSKANDKTAVSTGVDVKLLKEYTFFEYLMNVNNKLSQTDSLNVLNKIIPLMTEAFFEENSELSESFLNHFEMSITDTTTKLNFSQLKSEKEKMSFFLKESVLGFQKDTQDLGFDKSLEKNEEFYLFALSHYELTPDYLALELRNQYNSAGGFL